MLAVTRQLADGCAKRQVIVLTDWFTKLPEHMRLVALHDIAAEGRYPGAFGQAAVPLVIRSASTFVTCLQLTSKSPDAAA